MNFSELSRVPLTVRGSTVVNPVGIEVGRFVNSADAYSYALAMNALDIMVLYNWGIISGDQHNSFRPFVPPSFKGHERIEAWMDSSPEKIWGDPFTAITEPYAWYLKNVLPSFPAKRGKIF